MKKLFSAGAIFLLFTANAAAEAAEEVRRGPA